MMDKEQLRRRVAELRNGKRSRRAFLREMAALGLSAPFVAQMLAHGGIAMAASDFAYAPTKAGGGGTLKLLWWQGPTLLNPHFAVGIKDQDGSRVFYEPLAGWDPDGNLFPILASDLPSVEAGTIDKNLTWVIWKLKHGVKWHDGQPFTADDCVFNWQYAADPATAATTTGTYKDIKVTKLDDFTIRIDFSKPTPFWADAFVSVRGMIIPKHLFEGYKGANSREAPTNLSPVGTGPYAFVDFKPGDLIRGKLNPDYHMPNRPHFDAVEMKGGAGGRIRLCLELAG
jgi:peptide/nickel transport system substrate-binding protein